MKPGFHQKRKIQLPLKYRSHSAEEPSLLALIRAKTGVDSRRPKPQHDNAGEGVKNPNPLCGPKTTWGETTTSAGLDRRHPANQGQHQRLVLCSPLQKEHNIRGKDTSHRRTPRNPKISPEKPLGFSCRLKRFLQGRAAGGRCRYAGISNGWGGKSVVRSLSHHSVTMSPF